MIGLRNPQQHNSRSDVLGHRIADSLDEGEEIVMSDGEEDERINLAATHRIVASSKNLHVIDPHLDLPNQAIFDVFQRIVAASLHCKGLAQLPMKTLQTAAYAVMNFLYRVTNETKKQAEISLRSKANVFDVTKALSKTNPQFCSRLFSLSRHDTTLELSKENEEFMKDVHSQLPLLRTFSSPSLDTEPVEHHSFPSLHSRAYWDSIGEQDTMLLHDWNDGRWERKRRHWQFVDALDWNLGGTGTRDIDETIIGTEGSCRRWTSGLSLHPYMPPLPSECFRLGSHLMVEGGDDDDDALDPALETRREQILEDNLYVQLLLPKILEEIPRIKEVKDEDDKDCEEQW